MAENQSGKWDEEEGYSFSKEDSEKKRVPLPSSDRSQGRKARKQGGRQKRKTRRRGRERSEERPVIRDRMDFDKMHHDFPDTHDYLQDSLKDIDFMAKRIKAMRRDRERDDDEERVTIKKRPQHKNENTGRVEPEEMEQSKEAKRRRVRNRAIGKVIRHLKEEGYSQEFIRENRDVIRRKVDDFLFKRDRRL